MSDYDNKTSGTTDHVLYKLGWTIDELSRLNSQCRKLLSTVDLLERRVDDQSCEVGVVNYALSSLQSDFKEFVKADSRHQRTPATHVLVTLVSPSRRNKNPYALPVCCIPYVGLSEAKARVHINSVIEEMVNRGMKVAGTVH